MKKFLWSLLIIIIVAVSAWVYFQVTAKPDVGKVETSGWLFKDSISIKGFADPTLDGVACHVTETDTALSLDESTDSAIACRQVKAKITGDYKTNKTNIFSLSKGLFFKEMRVDRFYDAEFDTLVYITYVKKATGTNASHSISTVPLYNSK
jgi:CreA protein